jgi:hypothetical protein
VFAAISSAHYLIACFVVHLLLHSQFLLGAVLAFVLGMLFSRLDISRHVCIADDHWFQGHAFWHFLTALSILLTYLIVRSEKNASVSQGQPSANAMSVVVVGAPGGKDQIDSGGEQVVGYAGDRSGPGDPMVVAPGAHEAST